MINIERKVRCGKPPIKTDEMIIDNGRVRKVLKSCDGKYEFYYANRAEEVKLTKKTYLSVIPFNN